MGYPKNFGEYARALNELAKVPAEISTPVAKSIQADMRRKFRLGQDPYGKAYAPLRPASLDRGRTPPPLRKYARFAEATPLAGAGVSVSVSHPQAGFHQTGTANMAKRIVVPDRAVPKAWTEMIATEFRKSLRRRVGGGAA